MECRSESPNILFAVLEVAQIREQVGEELGVVAIDLEIEEMEKRIQSPEEKEGGTGLQPV